MTREYKGFEIYQDDLGRWCVYNPKSSYSRDCDSLVFGSLQQAKKAIDFYLQNGYFE